MNPESEIERLGAFLKERFPDEVGAGDPESGEGESSVDVAIRLLGDVTPKCLCNCHASNFSHCPKCIEKHAPASTASLSPAAPHAPLGISEAPPIPEKPAGAPPEIKADSGSEDDKKTEGSSAEETTTQE